MASLKKVFRVDVTKYISADRVADIARLHEVPVSLEIMLAIGKKKKEFIDLAIAKAGKGSPEETEGLLIQAKALEWVESLVKMCKTVVEQVKQQ